MPVAGCQPLTRAELRRQNIKTVARKLFIEHGFHRTGIALIAKVSGVAVQQLYRDFPAKEDIIAAIVEEDCGKFADLPALQRALTEEDRQAIRDWLISAVCRNDADADCLFLEIVAESTRNARIKAIFVKAKSSMSDNVSKAFAGLAGQRDVLDEHRLLAEAFLIASIGSACTHAVQEDDLQVAGIALLSSLIDGQMG